MKTRPLSKDGVARLRAARIPVPSSVEELRELLEEAERDSREIPLDKALKTLRARLLKRHGTQ